MRVSGLRLVRMLLLAFMLAGLSALRAARFVRNFDDGIVVGIGRASFRERFTRQQFDGVRFRFVLDGSGGVRFGFYCGGMRHFMGVVVIVIFKIFENVADVQEGVAIQTNVHESRLHSGKDASDFTFVDAADEGELFFALDINFY
jgi:hypothetical protein